jgi:uncharacterized protein (TIGR01777 family)
MRVLVTGATGLLGGHVVQALLDGGDEVVGLTRDVERARAAEGRVEWHAWQPSLERPPAGAFAGVDAVVNLLGEPVNQRLTQTAKERIRASRVDATSNLVDAIGGLAPESRPGVLVSQSAVGYYGDKGDALVDEAAPPGDDFLARLCVDWEAAALGAQDLGLRVAVLRTGLVLTPEGGLLKQLLLPFKLGLGGPMAGGDQYMPWIHLADEVGLILWCLSEARATGPINATGPNPVTNREFGKALAGTLGRPAIFPTPKLAIAALRGRELADIVSGGQRALPRRAQDLGYAFKHSELGPALADLLA